MKKLVSLLLALTLLLSLSTTAMGAWYDEAVSYVVENGLMDPIDDPNADATRGEIVDAIWRMAGRPATESAAAWANAQGILTGYDGDYHLSDPLTREQLATMLWRNAEKPTASLPAYSDASDVASYAAVAVAWAQNATVMNGVGGGNFAPRSNVTRAQLAQILMNYPDRADTSAKIATPATAYRTGALSIAKQGLFSSPRNAERQPHRVSARLRTVPHGLADHAGRARGLVRHLPALRSRGVPRRSAPPRRGGRDRVDDL